MCARRARHGGRTGTWVLAIWDIGRDPRIVETWDDGDLQVENPRRVETRVAEPGRVGSMG